MRSLLFLVLFPLAAIAADKPVEIDPNTKIQGGADVRGSGANAGAGANTEERKKEDAEIQAQEQKRQKDKPTSERKPREDEPKERPLHQPR